MNEQEVIERLRNQLARQVQDCTDMRTLILILELLADDHPPLGYTEEELARARSRKAGRKGGYEQSEEASVLLTNSGDRFYLRQALGVRN